jgi:TrmH family RNA methyltransferase
MPRVRVVLVRPENAANVGACARLIRNTGLGGLDLVAPGDWRTVECWRTAWGAQEVLEEARVFEDLGGALEGVALALALSGRRGGGRSPLDIREGADAIAALGPEEEARVVFGPETSGLSNEEIACCGRHAAIPADPAQPSYNLSHAVAIAAYEVHRAGSGHRLPETPRRATHDEKERLLALLREGLLAVEALPRVNTDGYFQDWQGLVQRADVSARELKLLEHLARKMQQARPRG